MYIRSMSRTAPSIHLEPEEHKILTSWARASKMEQRLAFRAKIILAASRGKENKQIAAELNATANTVGKWRSRFAQSRLEGMADTPRPGLSPIYNATTEKRVLAMLDKPVPKGYSTWSGPLIAKALGDVSVHHVWRVLRKYGISLARRRIWSINTDLEFNAKTAAIVGLYLHPPENALVLSVDEKPAIQALKRSQGQLRLPNGKTLNGFDDENKSHGTTTLFTALDVVTGLVKAGHYASRRRHEFLNFMNDIVAAYPDGDLYVILDNLKTHKPKHNRWLSRHTKVYFHYAPTHTSWLNQIEFWLSILWKQTLCGVTFTGIYPIVKRIGDFINVYNKTAAPFEWRANYVYPVLPLNN